MVRTSLRTKFNFNNEFGVYKGEHFFSQEHSSKNLILVHGYHGHRNMYNWLIKPLIEARYTVTTFTVPHSYRSMNEPYRVWTLGIITCIDVLKIKEVTLIGHSIGGYAALIDSYDKRITKIIALAPPIKPDLPQPPLEYSIPIQIQCGTKDNLYSANREFYNKITVSDVKKFVTIEKGDHIQFFDRRFAIMIRFIINLGIHLPYIGDRTNLAEISIQEQHNQSLKEVINW